MNQCLFTDSNELEETDPSIEYKNNTKYTTTNETDGSTEPVTKNETRAAHFQERRHLSHQLPLINGDEGKGDEDDVGEEDVDGVEDDDWEEDVDKEERYEEGQEYFPSQETINGTEGTTEPVTKYETLSTN